MHSKVLTRILYPTILFLLILGLALSLSLPSIAPSIEKWVTPPTALALGLIYALIFGNTHPHWNKIGAKQLLQYSVVGLGFGMNINEALASSSDGIMMTIVSVFGTLGLGWLIGQKFLKTNKNTSHLVSCGTAICGGSAIAAISPVLKAKDGEISVALGVVFILNAIALFIFPWIGRALAMTQEQFGTWAAIAIHDTSSVVGAGASYGEEALKIATTVKLTRALWIIPVSLLYSFIIPTGDGGRRGVRVPLFIVLFIVATILNTYVVGPYAPSISFAISAIAKKSLILSLFFIGASLSRSVIMSIGPKAMIQGVLLWMAISVLSLIFIMS